MQDQLRRIFDISPADELLVNFECPTPQPQASHISGPSPPPRGAPARPPAPPAPSLHTCATATPAHTRTGLKGRPVSLTLKAVQSFWADY